ncbi:MAG: iron-containing alcohol dehydrogenase [Clostridiales Family XIII bacterium]|jgi:alcohol dehydrogenase class IV|nr:iron-containing alcohol dehydrogenase [Clostridiales Family XIII bacterium]
MARITVPRDIYFGRGSLDTLKTIQGKKALVVVGGGSVKRSGVLDRAFEYLKEAGIETRLFDGVEADPSVETIRKGAAVMAEFAPDWIIPIGGGSPIDASKAMWLLYEHPDADIYDINPFNMPPLRNKARFIAIPTTSGTASEVTNASVVCDYATGIKFGIAGFEIIPDIAILDPDVADTMPQSLTAFTGIDALTHATESFVAKFSSPFSAPYSLAAAKTVLANLLDAFGGDKNAKEEMHYAQCLAGIAFSSAMLGISHAMAHKTGAMFDGGHIPHGEANGIYLPYVIQYNAKDPDTKKRYGQLAAYAGAAGQTDDELIDDYIAKIRALNKALGIPANLREFGIPEGEWNEKADAIAENAMTDSLVMSNPRDIDIPAMRKVLQYIYEGKDIDF